MKELRAVEEAKKAVEAKKYLKKRAQEKEWTSGKDANAPDEAIDELINNIQEVYTKGSTQEK
jgi:hypothetical protein